MLDVLPHFAPYNRADMARVNAVQGSDCLPRLSGSAPTPDVGNAGSRQLARWDGLATTTRPVGDLVSLIPSPVIPPKIGKCVVGADAVRVARLRALGAWTNKSFKNKRVDVVAAPVQAHREVPRCATTGPERLCRVVVPRSPTGLIELGDVALATAHPAKVADAVAALVAPNWLPYFVCHAAHHSK